MPLPKTCDYCDDPLIRGKNKQYLDGTFACLFCWSKSVHDNPDLVAKAREKVKAREGGRR